MDPPRASSERVGFCSIVGVGQAEVWLCFSSSLSFIHRPFCLPFFFLLCISSALSPFAISCLLLFLPVSSSRSHITDAPEGREDGGGRKRGEVLNKV